MWRKNKESEARSERIAHALQETTTLLDRISERLQPKKAEVPAHSEDEKRRAAYALNLCMVSISQIIDYDDLIVLDQEYDAILNNLNLEAMPKDEALLHILKQMLDTITFFRIQEGDKKFVERRYQQNMKNAIWSAVPNFGMMISTGNPWTMALSLATQVGIGYMNYRKAKAEKALERDEALWRLQRSAMEQFNGLRRELFDTAWRLADEYDFPDNYRLTERQIKQYNEILMDSHTLRRYERLDAIKDNFEAYPPFWYFFGHAAAEMASDLMEDYPEIAESYQQKAGEHFDRYFSYSDNNTLLREDEICAACALEYIDLLDPNKDQRKIEDYIRKAMKSGGGKNDILQLCALDFMRIGNQPEAMRLLRILVTERYNTSTNAQLLSGMYVSEYLKGNPDAKQNYQTLCALTKEDNCCLYFLPDKPFASEEERKAWDQTFLTAQKLRLLHDFFSCFKNFYTKNGILYNDAETVQDKLAVLNNIYAALKKAPYTEGSMDTFRQGTEDELKKKENKDAYLKLYNGDDLKPEGQQALRADSILKGPYIQLFEEAATRAANVNAQPDISKLEGELAEFDHANELHAIQNGIQPQSSDAEEAYSIHIFMDAQQFNKYNEMMKVIEKYSAADLIEDEKKFSFLKKDEPEFETYFQKRLEEYPKPYVMAVLNDHKTSDFDLVFCADNIIISSRNLLHKEIGLDFLRMRGIFNSPIRLGDRREKYGDVVKQDADHLVISQKYNTKGLHTDKLLKMIRELALIEEKYEATSPADDVLLEAFNKVINNMVISDAGSLALLPQALSY